MGEVKLRRESESEKVKRTNETESDLFLF